MSLILRTEELLERTLEDPEYFGWPIVLSSPLSEFQEVHGQARHISMGIDMDTGLEVFDEQASVTVRLSTMTIGEPVKGWRVDVTDTSGITYNCYVVDAMPDRTLGLVVLKISLLETA